MSVSASIRCRCPCAVLSEAEHISRLRVHLIPIAFPRVEPREESQDEEGQHRPQQGRGLPPHPYGSAHCRGQPEAGGSRQALNLLLRLSFKDCPGSEKSHTSDDALENTAQIREWHASLVRDHDEEGRPESHEHVRPEPGCSTDLLSLEAQQTAEQRCQQQAQYDLGDLRHAWQISKIALHPSPHLMPQGVHRSPPPSQILSALAGLQLSRGVS